MATKDILYSVSNIYVNSYPSGFVMDIDGTNNNPIGITHKVLIKRDSTTLVTITMPDPFAIGMQRRGINLTSEQITAIQNGMPDVASFTATIVLQTFNNGTQVGDDSISSAVISVSSVSAPVLADFTYADAANRTGNPNRLLNGLSELTFYNVNATAKAGASIVRYEISTSTGETKSFSSGGTLLWSNWGTSPFDSSANVVFTITVYDSRGLSASRSKTIYVVAYTIATLTSYSVKRNLIDPTSFDISFIGTYTNTGSNLPEIDYKYRVYGSGSYSDTYTIMDQEMTIEGNQFSFSGTFGTSSPTMAADKTYEFVLISYDVYTETVTEYNQYYYITIPTTQMHLSFRENALGIGGVPTGTKTVEVASEWSLVNKGKYEAAASQFYSSNSSYAINMHNSDLIGANGIYMADTANAKDEGIIFPRSNSNWDTIYAYDGEAYIRRNWVLGGASPSGIRFITTDDLYYKPGDTFSCRYVILNGIITSGSQGLRFMWRSPKMLDNISTVTVTAMSGSIRTTLGYIDSNASVRDWTAETGITLSTLIRNSWDVTIALDNTSAFTNATNNTPISFYANTSFVLTFT